MKLSQNYSNLIFFAAASLVTLYSEGYTEDIIPDAYARLAFVMVIGLKMFLVNAGYRRLPNGEILPPSVRDLPAGENVRLTSNLTVKAQGA